MWTYHYHTTGNWDALLVKFDALGNVVWSKSFGSPMDDYLFMVKSTSDGGFIVTGTTFQAGSDGNLLAAKINGEGNIIWQINLGSEFELEEGRGTCEVADGYLFTGFSGSNSSPTTYFAKIDLAGNFVWAQNGISGFAAEPIESENGEIWVVTATKSFDYDGSVIRMTTNGDILGLLHLYGNGNEGFYYIKRTGDDYIVSDHSWGPSGNTQFRPWLQKLNNSGQVIWSKSYDVGTNGRTNAEVTSDNGTIFCPYIFGVSGPKAILVKTNGDGDVLWAKLHTFPEGMDGNLQYIKETPDGGFTAVGFCPVAGNGTDLVVFQTDAAGMIGGCTAADFSVSVQEYTPPQYEEYFDVSGHSGNNLATLATTNITLSKIDQCEGHSESTEEFLSEKWITLRPNPAQNTILIETPTEYTSGLFFEISNILGEIIIEKQKLPSPAQVDISWFAQGTYILTVHNNERQTAKKIIKL